MPQVPFELRPTKEGRSTLRSVFNPSVLPIVQYQNISDVHVARLGVPPSSASLEDVLNPERKYSLKLIDDTSFCLLPRNSGNVPPWRYPRFRGASAACRSPRTTAAPAKSSPTSTTRCETCLLAGRSSKRNACPAITRAWPQAACFIAAGGGYVLLTLQKSGRTKRNRSVLSGGNVCQGTTHPLPSLGCSEERSDACAHQKRPEKNVHPLAPASAALSNRRRIVQIYGISDVLLRFAADGRPYYVDNNNRTTQWEHPIPLPGPQSTEGEVAARVRGESALFPRVTVGVVSPTPFGDSLLRGKWRVWVLLILLVGAVRCCLHVPAFTPTSTAKITPD